MAEVVTFVDYRPPARYDSLAWTQAQIQESVAVDGVYAVLETKTLSPLDADPSAPMLRSFTTELGTGLGYWYRIVFLDATGDTSQPTTPVQNVAGSTSAPHSYVDAAELGRVLQKTAPTVAEQTAMTRVLQAAAQEIDWDLSYGPDNPPPATNPILADVNLDRAVELWRFNYSAVGVLPVAAEQAPIVAPRDTWYRHHLRLNPLRTLYPVA